MMPVLAAALAAHTIWGTPAPAAPLTVTTDQPGAAVALIYSNGFRAGRLDCTTPCTLLVPASNTFTLTVQRDGVAYRPAAPIRWRQGLARDTLEPSTVAFAPRP